MLVWRWECDGKPFSENGNVFHSSSQHNQRFTPAVIHGQSKCQINMSFDWLPLSLPGLKNPSVLKSVFNQICVYRFICSDMDVNATAAGCTFVHVMCLSISCEKPGAWNLTCQTPASVKVRRQCSGLKCKFPGGHKLGVFCVGATIVFFYKYESLYKFESLSPSIMRVVLHPFNFLP